MALPLTLTCTGCGAEVPVVVTDYRGIQQPDPLKDGYHAYVVGATCTSCKLHVVTLHKEATKL